jgi:tRNA(Ile2) C34 agmatinyltransferase TiaS
MNRRHLHNLCALLGDDLNVEQARDEVIAAATARPPVPRCERCGARLSRKRHRCSRCGLRQT